MKTSKTYPEIITTISEAEEAKRGEEIARRLSLKPLKEFNPVRYETTGGNKTALGLFRTMQSIIINGE